MPTPIICIDPLVRQFAERFRSCLSKPQFEHLETVLLGLLLTEERRTLAAVVRQVVGGSSLSGLSRFLSVAPWSAAAISRQWIADFREVMTGRVQAEHARQRQQRDRRRGRPKKTVVTGYLIGDDSTTAKTRGEKMGGIGRHYSSTERRTVTGHSLVLALYSLLGGRCPLAPQLYRQSGVAQAEGEPFVSTIRDFQPVADTLTHVLLDSWYTCKATWKAAHDRGFLITSGLKRNRFMRLEDPNAPKGWRWVSVADYAASLSPDAWQRVRWPRQYGDTERWVWVHTVQTRIRKLYRCQLILAREHLDGPDREIRFWASSDLEADRLTLLGHIAARWDIEVLFEDAKELLGLDHYQLMTAQAVLRFWTLVLAIYRLLDEHRLRLQSARGTHVTIGQARRDLQQVHRLNFLSWCFDQFAAGVSATRLAQSLVT